MSSARRSLLTATAAGSLLGALWFVPSATASGEQKERAAADRHETSARPGSASAPGSGSASGVEGFSASSASDATRLAETGSTDTTPYLAGGLTFLISGVGIFALSKRRFVGA
ncbi:LAETG motif-containing sortase-dependent surface protein [Streptomyces sp. N35]|uniref:LAETG motif-containing sortase-dependent surface protein n=1 Tax=Streptomyces sp. N35 TaxID=2795730 RepID=UPI0018F568F7|nr:LAETG motif-containing sortase-dependent surface protein [Streptomyces sp. N35]